VGEQEGVVLNMGIELKKEYYILDVLKWLAEMPYNVCPGYNQNKRLIDISRYVLKESGIEFKMPENEDFVNPKEFLKKIKDLEKI
jgi:hypothetical protein